MLTTRRVQEMKPGGSKFITLPSKWTKKFDVEKGDAVIIQEMENGNLMVSRETMIDLGASNLPGWVGLGEEDDDGQ